MEKNNFFDSSIFTNTELTDTETLLEILNNNTKKKISPLLNNYQDFFSDKNDILNKKNLFLFIYPEFSKNKLYRDIYNDVIIQFCQLVDISEFSSEHVYMYINKEQILNNLINIIQFNKQLSYENTEEDNIDLFESIYNNIISFYERFYLLKGKKYHESIRKLEFNHNNIKIKFLFQYRKKNKLDLDTNLTMYLDELFNITSILYKKQIEIDDDVIQLFFKNYKKHYEILLKLKKQEFDNMDEISKYLNIPIENNNIILFQQNINDIKFLLEIRDHKNFSLNFARISYKTVLKN